MNATEQGGKSVIRRFASMVGVVLPLCLGGMYLLAESERAQVLEQVRSEEARLLQSATTFGMEGIGHDIHEISDDLVILINDASFTQLITGENPEIYNTVAQEWLTVSHVKRRRYDQIRWIDETGMERLRVDNRGEVGFLVPEAELQDKSSRYYFTDAMQTEPGGFNISPLDLNIEHGEVEQPWKPMVRVSMRVFTPDGVSRGIVIINYRAQMLLDHFQQVMLGAAADVWLANHDGYWLIGPAREYEWGFMFDRPEASLAAQYPEAWQHISTSGHGQVETISGLWSFATIYPEGLVMETSREVDPMHFTGNHPLSRGGIAWKTILHVPQEQWSQLGWDAARSIYLNGGILTILVVVAAWILAYLQVERQRVSDRIITALEAEQAASRSKDAFLANISHELRTPLNAIMGFNRLLMDSCSGEDQLRWLERVEQSSENLLGIIDNLLDLSRIQGGNLEITEERFNVDSLLNHVTSSLQSKAHRKSLSLKVDRYPASPWLLGDQARLRQALEHLVSNAVKFTEQGEVRVRALVLETEGEHVLVRFEVQDTGPGIAPEVLQRLFQPFRLGDESATRSFGGTGLGLVMTRRLAQVMGGDADAQSEPGKGSLFWFTARLKQASTPPDRAAADPIPSDQLIRRDYLGQRVLLAEDSDENREVTLVQLNNAGLLVEEAEDGAEAVRMNREQEYLLLIMDVHMPRLDGLEATRQIRSGTVNADVPILALTASVREENREACLEAGMDGFITKPASPEKMYRAILDCIDGKSRGSQSATDPD